MRRCVADGVTYTACLCMSNKARREDKPVVAVRNYR